MEIVIKNEYRVEVGLTETELSALGVRFETLDYGRLETRRAVWTLIGELRRRGVEVRLAGKVLIEAEKTQTGCVLAITVLPPKGDAAPSVKQLVRTPKLPAVFAAPSAAQLVNVAARVGKTAETSLFYLENRWLFCVEGDCAETALLEAEEYLPCAVGVSRLLPVWLREHAVTVAEGNAAAVLCAGPLSAAPET